MFDGKERHRSKEVAWLGVLTENMDRGLSI